MRLGCEAGSLMGSDGLKIFQFIYFIFVGVSNSCNI